MAKATVLQNPENPIPAEVLAESIAKISKSLDFWERSGMKRIALVVLLQHKTKLGHKAIEQVLNAIESLQADYCISKKKPTA